MYFNLIVVILLAFQTFPVSSISCYRGTTTSLVTDCNRLTLIQGPAIGTWGSLFGEILRGIVGDDVIANFVAHLQNHLNLKFNNQQTTEWVKTTLKSLEYDIEDNCYITYETTSGITTDRGCGAGGDILQYMQGTPYVFWTNSVCFPRPGTTDQEVCLCNLDGCNKDVSTARTAANIAVSSKLIQCGGKDCPLADLSKVDPGLADIDTSCYTSPGSTEEHCFTTEGIFDPLAVAAAKDSSSSATSQYKFSRVNGAPAQPSCFMCSLFNANNNNNNNNNANVNTGSTNTIASTAAAATTPDPYISMEIGNWRETLGVPGSSSVEFSGNGNSRLAEPSLALLYYLVALFLLFGWLGL